MCTTKIIRAFYESSLLMNCCRSNVLNNTWSSAWGRLALRTNNCALADIPIARRTAAERACLSLALLPWRPRKQTHKLSARANASGGWSFRSSRKTYLACWHQVKWPSASCVNQTGPTTTICFCWRFKAFWGQRHYTRVWERVHQIREGIVTTIIKSEE